MLRYLLALLALAAPAAAQIEPPDTMPAARDPRVTRVVTASRTILPNGTIRHTFTLGADVTASDRERAWCESWEGPDCESELTGDLVYIEGVRGFLPGETWQSRKVRTHCDWISIYDWECAENLSSSPQSAIEVSSGLIPEIHMLHPLHWSRGGHGYAFYFVGYGFGTQVVPAASAWDGSLDWSGPSGGWSGQVNNTNPSADNQQLENDNWIPRRILAEYGNRGDEVPVYFTPTAAWNWHGSNYEHACNWTLPSPGCIGCDPKPMYDGGVCSGHAWAWPKSSRMDCRAAMKFTIDFVPANQAMEYVPDPREMLGRALAATMHERERWPWIFEHRGRILSVDRDTATGSAIIGVRPE